MTDEKTAAVVVIGNEVLGGQVEESNATFLTAELRRLGVRLKRIEVLPDEIGTIAECVRDLSGRFDFVVTTGGVGPTHDDVTLAGIAQAFGRRLERNAVYADRLEAAYGEHTTPRVLTMADLPENASLVGLEHLRIPVVQVANVYVFPGIPRLLQNKFNAISDRFACSPFRVHRVIVEIEESLIARHLEEVQERFPDLSLGSYPRRVEDHWQVTLQLESKSLERLDEALEELVDGLPHDCVLEIQRHDQKTSTSPSE